MQRFKASLTCGVMEDNPESLLRDGDGEYVFYADAIKAILECVKCGAVEGDVIEQSEKPVVGEKWYIKHKGASILMKVEVLDITKLTVEIIGVKEFPESRTRSDKFRYKISDVEFVEKYDGSLD